jgi:hypothetical protein
LESNITQPIKLQQTEVEIKNILDGISLDWRNGSDELQGDKKWTIRVKKLIGDLGDKLGYKVCTSGFDCYHGEWLYDLVWFLNNENGRLNSIPLVLECEWKRGLGDIQYDFEKLLLANSQFKVMICQANNNISVLKDYFHNAVKDYNALKKGERFFIAILDDVYSGEFIYDLIIKE